LSPKAGKELARVPRSAIASIAMGDGKLTAPMQIDLEDGIRWDFDVPRVQFKNAREVTTALGA